jgi:hypothetical protein
MIFPNFWWLRRASAPENSMRVKRQSTNSSTTSLVVHAGWVGCQAAAARSPSGGSELILPVPALQVHFRRLNQCLRDYVATQSSNSYGFCCPDASYRWRFSPTLRGNSPRHHTIISAPAGLQRGVDIHPVHGVSCGARNVDVGYWQEFDWR